MMKWIGSYKHYAAWLLLLLMAVVLLPKELWHEHSELEIPHHHGEQHETAISPEEDCPICDFQLLPYSALIEIADDSTPRHFTTHAGFQTQTSKHQPVDSFAGRAPPSFLS